MIQYVIFDFDGTLVDSKDVFLKVINEFNEKNQLKRIEIEDVERLIRLPVAERCKELKIPFYKIPLLAPELYLQYKNNLKYISLVEGIKDVLDRLVEKGYRLAVISSNAESNIREYFHKNQIDCFEHIICSSNIFGKDKMLKKFMKQHKLKASEILYVGDEHRDIEACKRCGVGIIWVAWGYDKKELVIKENPDYVAEKPEDLLKIL